MEFSPPKRLPKQSQRSKWFEVELPLSPENQVEEKPVLILKPFSSAPHISFNKVKLGSTKCCILFLQNPLDISQVVRIEKVPSDKGFHIEVEELVLAPGEEKPVKILWAPEKASSYRETIAFRSSTGCKTHAYLLGTAYSPVKKARQKTICTKNKKHCKKSSPPKTKITENEKNIFFHNDFNICEEKKENLDLLNAKFISSITETDNTSFKFSSSIEPRASFCLKNAGEFPDSPIRRQTYTINTMLKSSRESEILPFFPKELRGQNTLSTNQLDLTSNNIKHDSSCSKMKISHPLVTRISEETNPNDSLEIANAKSKDIPKYFDDSLSVVESEYEPVSPDITCAQDSVETFDIESKHLYFGYTPQPSQVNQNPEFPKAYWQTKEKELPLFKRNTLLSLPSDISSTCCHEDTSNEKNRMKSEDLRDILRFPDFPEDSLNCPSFSVSELSKLPCHNDKSDFLEESVYIPEKYCQNAVCAEVFSTENPPISGPKVENSATDFQGMSRGVNIPKETEDSVKVLKETKTSLFMEIPCDVLNAPSDDSSVAQSSKSTRKHFTFAVPTKRSLKSQKPSPFKAKTFKPRLISNKKDSIQKTASCVTSKLVADAQNRTKLSKRMPHKLTLKRPPRISESVVYHRNPFASMNIYYDEHWIEKQEAAFTSWLNFILTPNDDFSSEDVKVDSAKLWVESIKEMSSVPAPTKEELSLKAYTAARNLNDLRKASFNLYQSDDIVAVIKKIEKEVDLKRISIRKDRAIHADLGIKKTILEMLLSYNTLWLRIGLETVYGEVLSLQNNADVLGLSRFIVHRFLSNPEICSKFSHPAVINYYKKGYEDEINRFILKKFLLLVFFLDTAKNVHLIKHNPCLFNKNAKFKSSRDLLLAFSREYLSGEGDLTKHLRYLGYKVSYQQTALEEFDYSVRNLAIDLRCGLRLGRVVELVLQDWSISQSLRINTLNRLTKIHNNDVILKALKRASIDIENNIEAKHITDGDREKTLDLLWQIIFKTQISKLINKDLLKKEIAFLYRSLKLRADFAAYNALRKPEGFSNAQEFSILDSKLYKENEILQLLFQWCQYVCAHYGVRIYNFTSSFSDGRALCFLLHHYHPNVLPHDSIKTETSRSFFEKQMQIAESEEDCPFFVQSEQSNVLMERLLKNERENLSLVFQKFQEVGNIPILAHPSDLSNTMPDEKVMVTVVSYINIRLMELSIEIRAARKILHAWHKYKLRKQQQRLKIEIQAVTVICKAWKKFLERKRMKARNKAAVIIQSAWRMHSAKEELKKLREKRKLEFLSKNAVRIQAAFRGFSVRKENRKKQLAATVIQAYVRRWIARSRFIKLRKVCLKIQQVFRAKVEGQNQRLYYLNMRKHTIRLQAYARGLLTRRYLDKQMMSAIKIQAFVRMWFAKKKYEKILSACILIQRRFRGYLLTEFYSQEFQNHRSAAVVIQKWYRTVKIQQHRMKCIKRVQACVRRFIARKKYLYFLQNVRKIQVWWRAVSRGKKARLQYIHTYKSIVRVQSFVRKCIALRKYKKQKESALIIQKYVRAFIAKRKFQNMRKSAMLIQNVWRSKCLAQKVRSDYLSNYKKVILAQAAIRRFIALHDFKKKKHAAVVIQKHFRAYLQQKKFHRLKSSTIVIQRKWRATLLTRKMRASFLSYRKCTIYVQSATRRKIAQSSFRRKKQSAIVIQKNVRMLLNRKKYLNVKRSVLIIQNHWRKTLLGRQIRHDFLRQRKAAITIQSVYRMYLCKKRFFVLKRSVRTVERYQEGKLERKMFLKKKQSAIKLQSVYRGFSCRKQYLKSIKSIVLIQACARRFILRKKYLRTRMSVIKIQRFYQGYRCMCNERQKFLHIRNGFIKLQAIYRGWHVRRNISLLNKKATIIQSFYRRWKALTEYRKMKQSCLIIQARYRAKIKMKKQYQEFMKIRESVIKIQAFVRCCIIKKKYKSLKVAAIKIQSYLRMIKCFRMYGKMKTAAIIIQQFYRSYKLTKTIQNEYLHKRCLIIFLQSKVRSSIARRNFLRKKNACILLQSSVRAFIQRKKYIRIRDAAHVIQKYYRSLQLMKKQRQVYLQQRKSVILLQSLFRSMIDRKRFLKAKMACILIQSSVRMHLQHKSYIRLRNAAIVIQRFFRNQQVMRAQRNAYIQQKQRVIFLQSKVRSLIIRKKFLEQKNACILLQSFVRMYIQQQKYVKIRKAAVSIQRFYRNYQVMKKQRNAFLQQRQSVIYIQSKVRSLIARQRYLKKKKACIVLQSVLRMHIQHKNYVRVKNATVSIQRYYRNWRIAKIQRDSFIHQKQCIIRLQANIRCQIIRRKFLILKSSSILIQSCIRMYLQQKQYHKFKKAAVCLQKHYRSWKCMKVQRADYLQKRYAAIVLQSNVRALLARKEFLLQKKSCIILQTAFRMYNCRKKYIESKTAAITIQNYYRCWKLMKSERSSFLEKRTASILIQSQIRSLLAKQNFLKQRTSCIRIQSYYRMHLQRKRYNKIRDTTVFLQRYYRNARLSKKTREDFIKKREAAICLQSKARCLAARKRFLKLKSACIVIQSFVRAFIQKNKYERVRKASVAIQKHFRSYKLASDMRKRFLVKRSACIKLQSYFRMYKCRKEFSKLKSAVVFVQRKFRAKLKAKRARLHFLTLKYASIKLQSHFRKISAMKQFALHRKACIRIQSKYRSFVVRKRYLLMRNAVLTLQKYFFAWRAGKNVRCQFLALKRSTIIIQSIFRGYLVRKSIQHQRQACVKIQTCVRKYICRKNFLKQLNAVLTLQKYVKSYLISKKVREQYVYTRNCIITSQAIVRGYLVRRNLKKLNYSASKIQAAFRSHIVRMQYVRQKEAAVKMQKQFRSLLLTRKLRQEFVNMRIASVTIQSAFRSYRRRKEFLRKKEAVIIVQAHVRKFLAQKKLNELKRVARIEVQTEAAIKIQKAFRFWKLKKNSCNMRLLLQNQMDLPNAVFQHLWFINLRKSIISFQQAARAYLLRRLKAAIVIQSYFRMWLVQKHFKRVKAALKIQTFWRAYRVRRSITDKKIIEARKRIHAADASEAKKLKNRTTRSLKMLFEESQLKDVLTALQELDTITALSPKCCERLVESGGLKILIRLVQVCNRSVPHIELIRIIVNILLNLAKYDKTVDYVWEQEGSLEVIFRLMNVFREKGTAIFTKCCSLLWIFCQDPAKVEVMKSDRSLTEQIQSHHYLISRKQSLAEKRHILKAIANKSFNTTMSFRNGNASFLQRNSLQIDPDWKLGRNRCREFKDPAVAISWIMKSLNLKSKGSEGKLLCK